MNIEASPPWSTYYLAEGRNTLLTRSAARMGLKDITLSRRNRHKRTCDTKTGTPTLGDGAQNRARPWKVRGLKPKEAKRSQGMQTFCIPTTEVIAWLCTFINLTE